MATLIEGDTEPSREDKFHNDTPGPRKDEGATGHEEVRDENDGGCLELMRARVEEADPLCQGIDDAILERFLANNSMDVNKASEVLLKYQKWRRAFAPLGYIPDEEIMNERKKAKLCLQGHDKKGRSIGVFLVARHDAFDRDLEEFKRYSVYAIDKALTNSRDKLKQIVAIVDLEGWGYKSMDIRGYLALLDILQDHYLNHLGKMILIHVPYIFWAAWKITSPFFNEFTKERMLFVEDKNLKCILLQEIDEDQLPDIYGGKLSLQPA